MWNFWKTPSDQDRCLVVTQLSVSFTDGPEIRCDRVSLTVEDGRLVVTGDIPACVISARGDAHVSADLVFPGGITRRVHVHAGSDLLAGIGPDTVASIRFPIEIV